MGWVNWIGCNAGCTPPPPYLHFQLHSLQRAPGGVEPPHRLLQAGQGLGQLVDVLLKLLAQTLLLSKGGGGGGSVVRQSADTSSAGGLSRWTKGTMGMGLGLGMGAPDRSVPATLPRFLDFDLQQDYFSGRMIRRVAGG